MTAPDKVTFAKLPVVGEDDYYVDVRYRVLLDGAPVGTVHRNHSKDWGWSTRAVDEITCATRAYAVMKLLANPERSTDT